MELPLRLVAADPLREGRGGVSPTTARPAIAAGADGLGHLFADSPPEPGFAEFAGQGVPGTPYSIDGRALPGSYLAMPRLAHVVAA